MRAFRGTDTGTGHHLATTPARPRTLAEVWGGGLPPVATAAEVDDGGAWEWYAELEDGADVTSLPFPSFIRAALDALGHGLGFAATHREAFRSLSVRRVTRATRPSHPSPETAH